MENSLLYISLLFVLTTLFCLALVYIASYQDKRLLYIIAIWLLFQALLRISGVYAHLSPIFRFFLLIIPPIVCIVLLFITKTGKRIIDSFDAKLLTLIHIYRIPLEIVLYLLFLNDTLPELIQPMDRNIEIIIGITAPIIYYFGCIKKYFGVNTILIWNILGALFLIYVVLNTNLSTPFPLQKFEIDESKFISYFYFPIIWLPSFIVPLFIFSHLVNIRQLILYKERFEK